MLLRFTTDSGQVSGSARMSCPVRTPPVSSLCVAHKGMAYPPRVTRSFRMHSEAAPMWSDVAACVAWGGRSSSGIRPVYARGRPGCARPRSRPCQLLVDGTHDSRPRSSVAPGNAARSCPPVCPVGHAHRHGCLLRLGGAAGRPVTTRTPRHRGRFVGARGGVRCFLRGAPLWCAFGHAHGDGAQTLPARGVRVGAQAPLCGSLAHGHGGAARLLAGGGTGFGGRSLPRRHGAGAPLRPGGRDGATPQRAGARGYGGGSPVRWDSRP